MIQQFEAAWRLHQFLTRRGVPYAIMGGLAVQKWGEPRFTRDVDLTILIEPGEEEPVVREMAQAFEPRIEDAAAFALKNRILLLHVPGAADADVSLGLPGYEEGVIGRSVPFELDEGKVVRVCSAEDLVIHKAVSGRAQDLLDLKAVIARRRASLDVAYIRKCLKVFAELEYEPAIEERFEGPWRRLMG